MKIDLNAVLNVVKPQPVTMTLDGVDYTLKRLSVADVRGLRTLGLPQDGDADWTADQRSYDHAATLFEGEPPPPLKVRLGEIADEFERDAARAAGEAVYAAINAVVNAQRGNVFALALTEASSHLLATRASTATEATRTPSTT